MAIIEGGATGALAEVDSIFKAQRVSIRPLDYGAGGTYGISMATGVMAAGLAGGSEVLQFRNASASLLCVVDKIIVDGIGGITAFTAGVVRMDCVIARSWSVDGSGGTAATMSTNNAKVRTSLPTSLINSAGAIRVASTAALSVGTKTLDAQAFGGACGSTTATAGTLMLAGNNLFDADVQHPLILGQNEGFVIRATVPATGTWTGSFTVRWTEVAAY